MARYKHIDTSPRFLAVDLQRQLLPGTFEHAMSHLLDHELDLSGFDARFCNDATGAAAYPPAMLLKVVLFAYSQGIVSSWRHGWDWYPGRIPAVANRACTASANAATPTCAP